jgi:hypothetical protein
MDGEVSESYHVSSCTRIGVPRFGHSLTGLSSYNYVNYIKISLYFTIMIILFLSATGLSIPTMMTEEEPEGLGGLSLSSEPFLDLPWTLTLRVVPGCNGMPPRKFLTFDTGLSSIILFATVYYNVLNIKK